MRKIIWSCWFQGRNNSPEVVKCCLSSWEVLNPEWEFRCLDTSSVGKFVDLAEVVDLERQSVTAASLSDIIRILLLHEYGGVWVDATAYCNRPLDCWLPTSLTSGFFAFSNPAPDRLLASWFLASEPNHELTRKWTAQVLRYWRGRTRTDDYFWFHHQFGELCDLDPEARAAWARVPKISADGPHAVQNCMHQPAATALDGIEWTTPVFKLTHRLGAAAKAPGTLLDHMLHRLPVFGDVSLPEPKVGLAPRCFAGLKVSTENLGDHVQLLAAKKLLGRAGIEPELLLDRDDEIASAPQLDGVAGPVGILLNGWFKTNSAEWPPHPKLSPVYLGFHIRLFQSPSLASEESLAHYRKHGPVGCRDRYTLALLQSKGVDAFLSHCLSLLFARRIADPENQTEVFVVSRDERIRKIVPPSLGSYTFINHYTGSNDFDENLRRAGELLLVYRSRARLIVTTLLHCALPAIAMGIPVVVFYPLNTGGQRDSDRERFSSLEQFVRVFDSAEAHSVDWRGQSVDVSSVKLALLDSFWRLAGKWGLTGAVPISPSASPETLPVPKPEEIERYLLDRERFQRMNEANAPDRQRWGNPISYKANWAERAELAATLIPDGVNLLEIGTGRGDFKRLVRNRCNYRGADLVPIDAQTEALDLDADPLPSGTFDYIVLLGVFEYLHHPAEAARKIAAAASHVLVSYCCVSGKMTDAAREERLQRGWVTHFGEHGFVDLFARWGCNVGSRTLFHETEYHHQIIFTFMKSADTP
jgi:hypothetical protein